MIRSLLIASTLLASIAVSPLQSNYFDCSVVYDEFDQLMMSNFLIEPDRYVSTLNNTITRDGHLQHQLGLFKLRGGRQNAGIGIFRTNQNLSGKMLFIWQDNAWEERTPLVIDELISFGRVRDGYAPVRHKSIYLTPGFGVDLDNAEVVETEDESADLLYEFEGGKYSIRAIEPAEIFFPTESMCQKFSAGDSATQ